MNLGERYKKLRETVKDENGNKVNTRYFAENCVHIAQSRVSELENNKREMSLTELKAYHEYFHISFEYLLGETDIKTSNLDIAAISKYTGLSELSIINLHKIQQQSQGEYINQKFKSDIDNSLIDADGYKTKLDNMLFGNPELKEKLDNHVSDFAHNTLSNQMADELKEAVTMWACIYSKQDDVRYFSKKNKYEAKLIINTLNQIIDNKDFYEFLFNVSVYSITNFTVDNNIYSAIVSPNNEESLSFDFSSSIIEKALLVKIQEYFRDLKLINPEYLMCDIDSTNDERIRKILYPSLDDE